MRKRGPGLIGVMAAALLIATACGGSGDTTGSGGSGGDRPRIALISKGFQHQFWQAVRQGAEKAAEEFDVEVTYEGPDSES
jgi:ribose transport system substrate-binding protein